MKREMYTALAIGIFFGMMLMGLIMTYTKREIKEEVKREPVTVATSVKSFEAQAMDDIEKRYEREKEEAELIQEQGNTMKAPYDFISLSDDYQTFMENRCEALGINFFLAASLMFSESSFNPYVLGDNGNSIGLFQINKCNWERMEKDFGLDVTLPADNIEAGLRIFKELMDEYPDDVAAVIQCYKCGIGRGEELMKDGVYLSCIEEIVDRAMEWQGLAEKRSEPSSK